MECPLTGFDCLTCEETCRFDGMVFAHVKRCCPNDDHDFQGWREFEDGLGGEKVCAKCGMGAMEATMRMDFP